MEYVKIGGRLRPIHFGMAALADFEELSGKGVAALGKELDGDKPQLMLIANLIYCGLGHGARKSKTPVDFENVYEVLDWVDNDPTVIDRVMELFTKSMAGTDEQEQDVQESPPVGNG